MITEIRPTTQNEAGFKFNPNKTNTWITNNDNEALALGLSLGKLPGVKIVEVVRAQFPETESKVICETK
ncbi:MAG TPA: hypothetical protein VG895_03830 [Patescibacteria group bacterium]|nr:hypothetical protein [Patescibacteria group bacterium]